MKTHLCLRNWIRPGSEVLNAWVAPSPMFPLRIRWPSVTPSTHFHLDSSSKVNVHSVPYRDDGCLVSSTGSHEEIAQRPFDHVHNNHPISTTITGRIGEVDIYLSCSRRNTQSFQRSRFLAQSDAEISQRYAPLWFHGLLLIWLVSCSCCQCDAWFRQRSLCKFGGVHRSKERYILDCASDNVSTTMDLALCRYRRRST